MGACDFETRSRGKTARDAFRVAVEDAQYESGHGGYTGTIAEKSGFVMIDVDAEVRKYLPKYQARLKLMTPAAQRALRKRYEQTSGEGKWRLQELLVHAHKQWDAEQRQYVDLTFEEACELARTRVAKQIECLESKGPERADMIACALAEDSDPRWYDKWGPACCIFRRELENGEKEFIFCGLASS